MSKCDHCHSRKGKRACPYLKGHICSTCCGENRGVRFDCPRDCPYFGPPLGRAEQTAPPAGAVEKPAAGEPAPDLSRYQRFSGPERRALADLMARLELVIARYDLERRGSTDSDVVLALEYLRRRASPIVAVERFAPEMGVFLEKTLTEIYRGRPAPGPYDLIEVLDHLIGTVRRFGAAGSRLYLEQVALFEKHYSAAARQGGPEGGPANPPGSRIILPR
jgi:hypothetical protein